MKFNFWETFAFQSCLAALAALVQSAHLSDIQKADIQAAIGSIQKVQTDFTT
jgi:hypothetical protein